MLFENAPYNLKMSFIIYFTAIYTLLILVVYKNIENPVEKIICTTTFIRMFLTQTRARTAQISFSFICPTEIPLHFSGFIFHAVVHYDEMQHLPEKYFQIPHITGDNCKTLSTSTVFCSNGDFRTVLSPNSALYFEGYELTTKYYLNHR